MARKFHIISRKDTPEQDAMSQEMHRLTRIHQHQHGYASEFEALFSLLTSQALLKKPRKEKEEREEKKI